MNQESLIGSLFRSLLTHKLAAVGIVLLCIALTVAAHHWSPPVVESRALLRVVANDVGPERHDYAATMRGILSQSDLVERALKAAGLDAIPESFCEFANAGGDMVDLTVRLNQHDALPKLIDSLVSTLSDQFLGFANANERQELASLEQRRTLLTGKINELTNSSEAGTIIPSAQIAQLETRKQEIAIAIAEANRKLAITPRELPVKNANAERTTLQTLLRNARRDYELLLTRYREKHPKVRAAGDQVIALEQRLRDCPPQPESQINPEIARLERAIQTLSEELTGIQRDLDAAAPKAPAVDPQEREQRLTVLRNLQQQVLSRIEQLNLNRSVAIGRIEVLNAGERQFKVIGGSLAQRLALALATGLLLSLVLLYTPQPRPVQVVPLVAPEAVQNAARFAGLGGGNTPGQLIDTQILGHAPLRLPPAIDDGDRDDAAAPTDPTATPTPTDAAATAEQANATAAFHDLRDRLQGMLAEHGVRSIAICSNRQGQGRTTLAANLAVSLAEAGYRTVIVDGNCRRPALHRLFTLENRQGLTTALAAGGKIDDTMLQKTRFANLDLLALGPVPPTFTELINGRAMADVLRQLRGRYTLVLIDTPAVTAGGDAGILAARAGAAIFLHREEESLADIRKSHDLFRHLGIRILGSIQG